MELLNPPTTEGTADDLKADEYLREQFRQLPKLVQEAITSAEISGHLQKLAKDSLLHVDQWAALENEVMLAILGLQPVEDLEPSIARELRLPRDTVHTLTENIVREIFEPIRHEMEKKLDAPAGGAAPSPVLPATPPSPPNENKVERAPTSASYQAQQPSHERKLIDGDPYREQML